MKKINKKMKIFLLVFFCMTLITTSIAINVNRNDEKLTKVNEYSADNVSENSEAENKVNVSVSNKPIVDVMLTSKDTNVDLTNFEDDVRNKLQDLGIDTTNVAFQTVERSMISTNASDASQIFNEWGRIGVAGDWSLTTYNGTSVIWNKLNTNGATGFYSKENYNIKDATIDFDMRTTDSDDDYIGVFLRFNLNSDESTAQANKKATTYMYIEQMNGVTDFKAPNGLYKVENNILIPSDSSGNNITALYGNPVARSSSGWPTKNAWTHYKFVVEGNNIKGYRQGSLIFDYTDTSANPISKGSFGLVNWSQPAMFANFTVSYTVIKEFQNVLREPTWRENAHHIVVNVDDMVDETLTGTDTIGEILTRTLNDDIHFIQWGTGTNQSVTDNFVSLNDEKGIFVDNSDYANCVEQTAIYIKNLIEQENQNSYVIVGEDNDLEVEPSELQSGAVSEDFPNGRWRLHHNYTYFANNLGQSADTEIYTPDLSGNFDKPGEYLIYFDDDLVGTVYAHRRPIADFVINLSDSNVNLTSSSFDLDSDEDIGFGKGIKEEKWYYKKATDAEWTEGKLTSYDGEIYVIKLEVTDFQECTSYTTKYIGIGNPVASFNYESSTITKYQNLVVNDSSYDPSGYDITKWEWTLKKGSTTIGTYTSQIPTVLNFNAANLGIGNYTYSLVVTNSQGTKSEAYTKAFTVIDDIDAPDVVIDPTYCDWKQSQEVNFLVTDNDSGLLNWRYSLDQDQDVSEETVWSEYITDSTYKLDINVEGLHYIHVQASDKAGNTIERTVGVYKIDRTKPEGQAQITQPTEAVKAAVINITATDDASGVEKIILPNGQECSGENATYRVTTPGDYTFTIVDNAGNEREMVVPVEILSLGVEVRYIDQVTKEEISSSTLLRGLMGQEYSTIAKVIDGYELVLTPDNYEGTYGLNKVRVTYEYRKNSFVTTKYINEYNGYTLSPQVDKKYKEGDTYTTDQLDIEGYTCTIVDGDKAGTVEREDITVTYYYKKNTSVTVKYVDMLDNNKEIAERVVISGVQNDDYETTRKTIDGYTFVAVEGLANGKMGYDPTEVIYKYKKASNLITEHRDANTNEKIVSDVLKKYKEGDAYEAYAQSIEGYILEQEPDEKTGIMGREDIVKTFYYKKVSEGLVVRYVDRITNELLDKVVYEGNENDEITLEEKSFLGYVLNQRPESDTVILGVTAKEVTFYYRKAVEINIIGIDQQTGEELYKTAISGVEGDPYTTTARHIDEYELVKTPNNDIGTYDRNDTEVIYEYRKIAERVVVKYIDQETGEELDSYIIEGTAGQNYKTEKKSFTNYKFIEVVGNEVGTLTNVSQEVIYYYQKTTGKVTVKYVDEDENELLKEELVGKTGDNYEVTIKDIPGYDLVEVIGETTGKYSNGTKVVTVKLKEQEPVELGKVIVKYVDQNNKEVLREELVGTIGEDYTATIRTITGYRRISVTGQVQGQYESEEKEIIVRLEKRETPAQSGNVIVKYIDQNNKEIRREEYQGVVGSDYSVKIKEIVGYKLVEVIGETSGQYETKNKEIIVKLEIEIGKVVVKYIDQDNNVIHTDNYEGTVGSTYIIGIKHIFGYKEISVTGDTIGEYESEEKEIIVRLELEETPIETGKVIVKYIDQDDKELLTEEITGNVGEDYVVEIKTIPGYKQVSVEGETEGQYIHEEKEIIVRLEKEEISIETGKVIVKYIDQDNKELLKEELTGTVGEDYAVEIKTIPGYKQISVTGQTQGQYETEEKEIIVRLEKEEEPVETGKVTVKYIDQDNNEIRKENYEGTIGLDYNIEIKEIPGYKQVSVEGETSGKYETEEKEIIVRLEREETPVETGSVVVKYIDQDNNQIRREEYTGTIGLDYKVVVKEISGYKIVEVIGETSGQYEAEEKEVIVKIEKEQASQETGRVTVKYIDEDNKELLNEQYTGTVGLDYKITVKEIEGYKIVEVTGETSGQYELEEKEIIVRLEKEEEVPGETGNVIVKYIDEDNNELRREEYTGTIGLDYKVIIKEISGYRQVSVEGETEGQYEAETKEIIVRLEKEEVVIETGNVIVRYIDQDNNEVRREEYTGVVGNDYNVIVKEVPGYKQISVEGETTGQYETEEKEIIVRLEKEEVVIETGNVIVRYIDQDNNEVRREEYTGVVGNDYNVTIKEISGYRQVSVEGETTGKYETEEKEIIVRLEKEETPIETGKVTVKYIDQDEKEVIREELTGNVGEDYKVTVKEIPGYKVVEVTGETEGQYETEDKEVIVRLEKEETPVETGKVTVKYVDKDGKELSKDEMTGNVGTDYKVTIKNIPGYKVVEVTGKTEGKYETENKEVIIKLEKEEVPVEKEGTIVIKYVDQDGNTIKEDYIEKGKVGEIFYKQNPEIDGYEIVSDKTISTTFKDGEVVYKVVYRKVSQGTPEEVKPIGDENIFDLPNTGDINLGLFTLISVLSLILIKKNFKKIISK